MNDYSHYTFAAFYTAVFAAQMVKRKARGDALFVRMASRRRATLVLTCVQ